jgi:hypothetical protein
MGFCLMAALDPVLNQSLLRMIAASLFVEGRLQSLLGNLSVLRRSGAAGRR